MFSLAVLFAIVACVASQEIGSPEVLSADTTPLVIESVEHDGDHIVVAHFAEPLVRGDTTSYNVYYGHDEDSLTQCEVVSVTEDNTIACTSVPRGAGNAVLVIERTGASGEVEARHRFRWTYRAPVVRALSGGVDGTPLVVAGQFFGPRDSDAEPTSPIASHLVEVFVGPFAAHSAEHPCAVSDDEGTAITCSGGLPVGFGTGLRVRVCVNHVCGTSDEALHSYPQPVVTATHVVEGRLHMYGSGFGPHIDATHEGDDSLPALAIEIDGVACQNPEIIVPDTEIACDADEHPHSKAVVLQRRDLRATLRLRNAVPMIDDIFPSKGSTDGHYDFIVEGKDFGPKGTKVTVRIGGRPATDCYVTESDCKITCKRAPMGVGTGLGVDVTTSSGFTTSLEGCFSYHAPHVSSASRASTRGGKIFVFGDNFGPSFAKVDVFIEKDGHRRRCHVEKKSHQKIQCDAPAGTGEHHSVIVKVAGQHSNKNHAFSYKHPKIVAMTRPHWRGGHMYIRGANFGTDDDEVSVYIDSRKCKHAHITKDHVEIRCRAPPGHADGHRHKVKVRVDGQQRHKHGSYANTAPTFSGVGDCYTAVACDPLNIRLHASDADHDDVHFNTRSMPEGADWKAGKGFMQIQYSVPKGLLNYPRTEMNVSMEAMVSDGPGTSSALLNVNVRACPASMDTCKDLSCVTRGTMCPRCPTSNTVRCGSNRPVLDTTTGECHPYDFIDTVNVAKCEIASAGFTVDVSEHSVLPLFNAEHKQAGLIEVKHDAVCEDGAQPCGETLTCIDVAPCSKRALDAAVDGQLKSTCVHVNSFSELANGVYLALPTDAGIGSVAADGYAHCLGKYHKASDSWHCVDESLTLRHNMLAGAVHGAGEYAIIRDNCPDHFNPMQHDRDANGEGDLCQGGATLCEDCGTWNTLNVKYLKKHQPEPSDAYSNRNHDEYAENQSPVIIATEEGDRFHAEL